MDPALLLGRLTLAAVFLVAALAKLADRDGSTKAAANFGVPERFAKPFGIGLPLVELAIAVALIPKATAWGGAVGALTLLVVFIAAIAANMARGRTPDCHCFGQLHSAPAGWSTLARNGLLATVAALVVWQAWDDPGASAVAWLGDIGAAETAGLIAGVGLAAAVALEAVLLLNLLRQNGRLVLRIEEL